MEYENLLKRIALNIKIERVKRQLTQEKLAELVDVHEKHIGKIEAGKQNITFKTLFRIATALNVDITKLLAKID